MSGRSQVVVVTGASAGVGRATVRKFARQGARIGLVARGKAGLEAARCEVEQLGGRAIALPTDVADAAALEEAATTVENELGSIDVWVNDAMVSVFSPAKEMTAEEYERVTKVTYLGYVYGTLAALRRMIPRNHGSIIQVGSALAYRGIPLQSAYSGAKHAIQGFTESVRCELLHDQSNVRISMVQMPALNTPQFDWVKNRLPHKPQPVPPIYEPEVAADAIVWAAHHYRPEWWVGGSTAVTIVGNKLAPSLGDHYLAHSGYQSQQTDGPSKSQADNLFCPQDDSVDHGARGDFSTRSISHSWQFWAAKHSKVLRFGIVGGLGVLAMTRVMQCLRENDSGGTRRCGKRHRKS